MDDREASARERSAAAHERSQRTHERAAAIHELSAEFWDEQNRPDKAAYEREQAKQQREIADLECQRAAQIRSERRPHAGV